jgi:hypothetical protein
MVARKKKDETLKGLDLKQKRKIIMENLRPKGCLESIKKEKMTPWSFLPLRRVEWP